MHCPAPAKLNLFLHVTGRRADGYHLLQTAFVMLDYADDIVLTLRDDGHINRVNDLPGVEPERDLVVRAARLLRDRTGCKLGVDIAVTKRLPMGGGLGGGSSDAASVLLGLNRLWQLDLPRSTLQTWALALGADVPFFIFGQTALATGVGEALLPLDVPSAWYVVIEPPVSVPTAEIFAASDLTRDTEPIIISGFAAPGFATNSRNDLQPVVCKRYGIVQWALDALVSAQNTVQTEFDDDAGNAPRMSGSGACVFLACTSENKARRIAQNVEESWRVWVAPALDRHPLWSFAQA